MKLFWGFVKGKPGTRRMNEREASCSLSKRVRKRRSNWVEED
jgi:hypothetical protein